MVLWTMSAKATAYKRLASSGRATEKQGSLRTGRAWLPALALLVGPAAFCADGPTDGKFALEGDLSALYASGDFVIWRPRSAGAPMMAAASTGESRSMEETLNVIAKAPLREDGVFRVEGVVDAPRRVYFHVLNARGHEGQRYAPVKGNAFILEPGQLRLTMRRRGRFHIDGGKYNDAVYNAWSRSPEYLEAVAEYERLLAPADGESEAEKRRRVDRSQEAFQRTLDLETAGRRRISLTHPDPLVRRLVIESTWLAGPWMLDALRGLAELTPKDPWVRKRLADAEERAAKRAKESQRFAVGADIRDFSAETLEGESVRLADVRANSKVVLVEFWASWCGPCRVEIPHMKAAYERYRSKGFEIVSFTIDNEREDWEIASEEEQLPWHNLGMGEEADAPKAYGVTGVPKNYLVDAETGDILARDLRGHHLDEKLAELLN